MNYKRMIEKIGNRLILNLCTAYYINLKHNLQSNTIHSLQYPKPAINSNVSNVLMQPV